MRKFTQEQFIEKARAVHGDRYDYSRVVYLNAHDNVLIVCPFHGEFRQPPFRHMRGRECPKCSKKKSSFKKRVGITRFISRANEVHGGRYDYSKTEYITGETRTTITCPKHGDFRQTPGHHLGGTGCPRCRSSQGELKILDFLIKGNFKFKPQYKFKECKNKLPLPFDFAVFNNDGSLKCLIEYQGRQHFESFGWFGGYSKHLYTKQNDEIKKDFCLRHNIKLLSIPYNKNIFEVLNNGIN